MSILENRVHLLRGQQDILNAILTGLGPKDGEGKEEEIVRVCREMLAIARGRRDPMINAIRIEADFHNCCGKCSYTVYGDDGNQFSGECGTEMDKVTVWQDLLYHLAGIVNGRTGRLRKDDGRMVMRETPL